MFHLLLQNNADITNIDFFTQVKNYLRVVKDSTSDADHSQG